VIVNVGNVGFSGTTTIQGIVDPGPVAVPGLTGTLGLTYEGVTNGGKTWNFDYTVTNTSSGIVNGSRISSFGLATTPNIGGAASTGLFDLALLNPSFPNVGGAASIIEVCFSAGNNSCSGGDGVDKGDTASGTFSLTFASALSSISLDTALFRFQEINAQGYANSGVGINNNVVITPTNVGGVPEASTWAMMILGFLGVGLVGMRRREGSRSFRMISA